MDEMSCCFHFIGSILVYPIVTLGTKINACQDEMLDSLRDIAFVSKMLGKSETNATAKALVSQFKSEPYHFKILQLPITLGMLRSIGTIVLTTAVGSLQALFPWS